MPPFNPDGPIGRKLRSSDGMPAMVSGFETRITHGIHHPLPTSTPRLIERKAEFDNAHARDLEDMPNLYPGYEDQRPETTCIEKWFVHRSGIARQISAVGAMQLCVSPASGLRQISLIDFMELPRTVPNRNEALLTTMIHVTSHAVWTLVENGVVAIDHPNVIRELARRVVLSVPTVEAEARKLGGCELGSDIDYMAALAGGSHKSRLIARRLGEVAHRSDRLLLPMGPYALASHLMQLPDSHRDQLTIWSERRGAFRQMPHWFDREGALSGARYRDGLFECAQTLVTRAEAYCDAMPGSAVRRF